MKEKIVNNFFDSSMKEKIIGEGSKKDPKKKEKKKLKEKKQWTNFLSFYSM